MSIVKLALVGAGGYGQFYLRALTTKAATYDVQLVGIVDPTVTAPVMVDGAPVAAPLYPTLAACLAANAVDLVAIAAPIHYHKPYVLEALAAGAHVLCEKPLCATIQDALELVAAQRQAGRFVAVGYQWSFAEAIGRLKADIMAGRLGQPLRFKAKVLWPRTAAYYARNNWAGQLQMTNGTWVLDSPVSNATAHYLHNLFYLLGDQRTASAPPQTVQAELYHANPIPNCDTAALRFTTTAGVEILYYTSHALTENRGPQFDLEFTDATVHYQTDGGGRSLDGPITAHFHHGARAGETVVYGDPFADETNKIWQCADAVRTGAAVACDVASAVAHILAVNGMHEAAPTIHPFPTALVRQQGDLTYVEGLQACLDRCYAANKLPAELGDVTWAQPSATVDLRDYRHFPAAHFSLTTSTLTGRPQRS